MGRCDPVVEAGAEPVNMCGESFREGTVGLGAIVTLLPAELLP